MKIRLFEKVQSPHDTAKRPRKSVMMIEVTDRDLSRADVELEIAAHIAPHIEELRRRHGVGFFKPLPMAATKP